MAKPASARSPGFDLEFDLDPGFDLDLDLDFDVDLDFARRPRPKDEAGPSGGLARNLPKEVPGNSPGGPAPHLNRF